MSINFEKINNTLTKVEKNFNIAGSLPIVGLVSGPTRAVAGKIQFLAGLAFFAIGAVGIALGKDKKYWTKVASFGAEQVIHGALNCIRGYGEFLLAKCYGLNFMLFIWQNRKDVGFEPQFFKYGHLSNQNNLNAAFR